MKRHQWIILPGYSGSWYVSGSIQGYNLPIANEEIFTSLVEISIVKSLIVEALF